MSDKKLRPRLIFTDIASRPYLVIVPRESRKKAEQMETYRLQLAEEPPVIGEIRYIRRFVPAPQHVCAKIELDPMRVVWTGKTWERPVNE